MKRWHVVKVCQNGMFFYGFLHRFISRGTTCCLPDTAAVGRGRTSTSYVCAQHQFSCECQACNM